MVIEYSAKDKNQIHNLKKFQHKYNMIKRLELKGLLKSYKGIEGQ